MTDDNEFSTRIDGTELTVFNGSTTGPIRETGPNGRALPTVAIEIKPADTTKPWQLIELMPWEAREFGALLARVTDRAYMYGVPPSTSGIAEAIKEAGQQ
jgi:hypothetical protein